MMEKKRIFISHIGEEASIGMVLKEWIESTYLGNCDVFLSSDIDDIPAGKQWFDEIDGALTESEVFIVLCSRNSISRPWINFEAGCGWIKKVPIISICYLGITKSTLPEPLSRFQNLNLLDSSFVNDLFSSLNKHFGLTKVPKIDIESMKKELKSVIETIEQNESDSSQLDEENKQAAKEVNEGLPEEADRILVYLTISDSRDNDVSHLARHFGMMDEKMKYYLDMLLERNYINFHLNMTRPTVYSLSPEGRKYLVETGLL